jgi:hypothetical protein
MDIEAQLKDMTYKFYKTEEFNSHLRLKVESYQKQIELMMSGTKSKLDLDIKLNKRSSFYQTTLNVPQTFPSITIIPSGDDSRESSDERNLSLSRDCPLMRSFNKSRFSKTRQEKRRGRNTTVKREIASTSNINY